MDKLFSQMLLRNESPVTATLIFLAAWFSGFLVISVSFIDGVQIIILTFNGFAIYMSLIFDLCGICEIVFCLKVSYCIL